jgi:hypothetical protein
VKEGNSEILRERETKILGKYKWREEKKGRFYGQIRRGQ